MKIKNLDVAKQISYKTAKSLFEGIGDERYIVSLIYKKNNHRQMSYKETLTGDHRLTGAQASRTLDFYLDKGIPKVDINFQQVSGNGEVEYHFIMKQKVKVEEKYERREINANFKLSEKDPEFDEIFTLLNLQLKTAQPVM